MVEALEITPGQAVSVVLSAIGMYASFLVIVRVFGARILARMSSFDVVVTLMLGAIAGRVVLGNTPVLAAGILGLTSLLLCEVVVGQVRRTAWGRRVIGLRPVLVVEDGAVCEEGLRRAHLTADELLGALRQAGVTRIADVSIGVFEPTGQVTVLRAGAAAIDAALLADVVPTPRRLRGPDPGGPAVAGDGAHTVSRPDARDPDPMPDTGSTP